MSRLLTPRLVPVALAAAVLAGCGSPPEPLPTAPPETHGGVPPSSGSAIPSFGAPTVPGLPTGGLPPAGLPTPVPTVPTYPLPTTITTTPTTPRSPTPSPAAKCTSGPSSAQVVAVIKGKPGIPNEKFEVHAGPYCSGSWQFTELEIVGKNADEVDPLLVVTTGQPTALTLVEAGADVCSLRVQQDAPPGIRVRACGF
ncbi:MAG TPA: hypothetical protein VGP57_03520 [Actinoplanes sp.]|nr:hypothetical protein [Actinoplanes sp.]